MTETKEETLTAAEEKKSIQQLAILRTKTTSSLLKPADTLTRLKELAEQRRTSTAVLVGIIIVAENITVSKKPDDNSQNKQPATNPELVPDAAQVIENAVKNPKSDEVVAEAADSAVTSIKDNAEPSQQDEVNKRLENIEKLLKEILKRMEQQQEQQQSNQTERPQPKPQERPHVRPDGIMPNKPTLDPSIGMFYAAYHQCPSMGVTVDGNIVTKDKDGKWDVIEHRKEKVQPEKVNTGNTFKKPERTNG